MPKQHSSSSRSYQKQRVKLKNRFIVYPGSNFIQSILKKLEEVKFALLLSTGMSEQHRDEVTSKLQEIEEVMEHSQNTKDDYASDSREG